MSEKLQAELQVAVSSTVDRLDKKVMRPLQRKTYLNLAKCFADQRSSQEAVAQCQQQCSAPAQQAQQYFQQELQDFQQRLQRCSVQCQDDMRDKIDVPSVIVQPYNLAPHHLMKQIGDPAALQNDVARQAKLQKELEGCVNGCITKHLKNLPTMEKRIEGQLKPLLK